MRSCHKGVQSEHEYAEGCMMVISRSRDENSRINVSSTKVKHVAKIMYLDTCEVYPEGITYGKNSARI